jgi:hypothetical protein
MTTAIVVFVIVLAALVGTLVNVRRSAKTGMPSQDVLDRAKERARQLEEEERREENRRDGRDL